MGGTDVASFLIYIIFVILLFIILFFILPTGIAFTLLAVIFFVAALSSVGDNPIITMSCKTQ